MRNPDREIGVAEVRCDLLRSPGSFHRDNLTIRFSWSLDKPETPVFSRRKLQHDIVDNSTFSKSLSFDDNLSFNTQSGSQWDGLRHVVHRDTGLLYNGVEKSQILGPQSTDVLGLNSEFIDLFAMTSIARST